MISILLGLIAGIATPTQTSINGRLRENNRSAYLTTLTSFGGAVVILFVIALLTSGLAIPFSKVAAQPLWIWSGGLCGTVIILMNTICLPHLGSANTVVLVSTGQIITGLVIDQFGLFGSPTVRMDLIRTVGALLVIAGVFLVSREKQSHLPEEAGTKPDAPSPTGLAGKIPYIIGALIGGAACGIQVAVNGTLSTVTGSSVQTTLISMSIGLISCSALVIVLIIIRGKGSIFDEPAQGSRKQIPDGASADGDGDGDADADADPVVPSAGGFKWWMFTGGAFGVIVVLSNAVCAPVLGAGLVTILNLVGMMATGLLIDAAGFLGIEKKPVTAVKTAGMLLMTAGTVLISLI